MKIFDRRALTGSTLIVVALLFVAVVMLSSVLLRGARLDLTANRLYTLTEGTKSVIGKLEEPIHLYFYFSDSAAGDLPQLRTYANRVRELLEEIEATSDGKIVLDVIDPVQFSEDEDRATQFGLQAVPLDTAGGTLFFGLAGTNSTDGQTVIPFFQPDKETFLEYDIAKLISSLSEEKPPVVGVLSSLDIGPGFDPASQRVTEGWVAYSELRNLFDVRRIEPNATKFDDDLQLLVLVHPKGLSDDTLYAVDQFVLKGGRLIVLVDPHAEAEQAGQGVDPTQAMFEAKSSDLPKLFGAWGVQFDAAKIVLDSQLALQVQTRPDASPSKHYAILGLGLENLNQDDVISARLEAINVSTAGHFTLSEDATTKLEPLAQSSPASGLIDAEKVRFSPDPAALQDGFTPSGQTYVLAGRLTGPVKTAFPDRSGEGHLAQSAQDINVVLVADTDLLADRMWVQVQNFLGQKVMNPFANNGDLFVNMVDNLVGSSDLIAVRTRSESSRPFTTVEAIRDAADARMRDKERELQAQLAEAERKLTELQSARSDQDAMSLTAEQQAELTRFQQDKVRIRKELRSVKHQLDADIDALGGRLKVLNIIGMPVLLTVLALAFALSRARRRKEARA